MISHIKTMIPVRVTHPPTVRVKSACCWKASQETQGTHRRTGRSTGGSRRWATSQGWPGGMERSGREVRCERAQYRIIIDVWIKNIYTYTYTDTYTDTYTYQHMPRGAVMAPLREGVSKWRPFISKVFLNLLGVIWDIHFIFVIWGHGSNAFEFYFWHPKNGACQTCHLRVGWMCRGCQNATPLG